MQSALDRFRALDTHVLGVSIDSVHCHANWGRDLGGVSFPLLADFEPKGAMAQGFGHYLADAGITDRATVVIDKKGIIRYSESVTPAGHRSVDDLLSVCTEVQAAQGAAQGLASGGALPADACLYVKSKCGPSRRVRVAADNLGVQGLKVCNVSDDTAAAAELRGRAGNDQAPGLWIDGKIVHEADAITRLLADRVAPLA